MSLPGSLANSVLALRPFVPAKDFATSKRFYEDLGFHAQPLGDALAEMRSGSFSFLLQDYFVQDWADNFMMRVLVRDVRPWWTHIEALDLRSKYDVRPPSPPKSEPWSLEVVYVVDPSGVLWHFASPTSEA